MIPFLLAETVNHLEAKIRSKRMRKEELSP